MTTNEITVSIVGVLLGYWIIGAIFGGKKSSSSEFLKSTSGNAGNSSEQSNRGGQRDQGTDESPPPGNQSRTWYEVLEISKHANLEEVQTAYRSLIRQYHPDKVATLGDELRDLAEAKSKSINQAYNDALAAVGHYK